jgi:hypothetical protein
MSEPEVSKIESERMKNLSIVALGILALSTTLVVVLEVAHHWACYCALQKFIATVLVAGVVLNPVQEIRAVKRGASDSKRLRAAVSWNSLLAMALILFTNP